MIWLRRSFERSLEFVWAKPKIVLLVFSCLFIASLVPLAQIKTDLTLEGSASHELDSVKHSKLLKSEFTSLPQVVLVLKKPTPFSREDLCGIRNWMRTSLPKLSSVHATQSIFDLRKAVFDDGKLFYDPIVPEPCSTEPWTDVSKALSESTLSHHIFDPGLKDFLFLFELNPDTKDQALDDLKKATATLDFEKIWVGEPVLTSELQRAFRNNVWVNILIICLIFAFSRFTYGTFKAGFFLTVVILITNLVIHGGMSWFGHPVDSITMGLFPLLSIAALEDFMYLTHLQTRDEGSWRDGYRYLLFPSFFTSLTTAIGFISLMFSKTPSIQILGLWAAVGAMFEWLLCFIVLPALADVLPAARRWALFKPTKKTPKRFRLPRPIAWSILVATYVGAVFFTHFEINNSFLDILPENHPFQKASREFLKSRGWAATADLGFRKSIAADRKKDIIAQIEKQKSVQGVDHIDAITNDFTREVPTHLKTLVSDEIHYLFKSFYSYADLEKATVYLKTAAIADIEDLRLFTKSICPNDECFLTGSAVIFAEDSKTSIATLFDSLISSLVMVAGLLVLVAFVAREKRNLAQVLLCSFWSICVVVILVGVFRIQINATTCLIASVLAGLTGDNSIQFLLARDSSLKESISRLSGGSWNCALLAVMISLTMLFSPFVPMRILGVLLAVGILCAYFGDVVLLSATTDDES